MDIHIIGYPLLDGYGLVDRRRSDTCRIVNKLRTIEERGVLPVDLVMVGVKAMGSSFVSHTSSCSLARNRLVSSKIQCFIMLTYLNNFH